MKEKCVINILGMECSPGGEERFNTWYNEKHVPDLLKCKAIKSARRFKLMPPGGAPEYPKFLAVYEFENTAKFDEFNNSPELASARKDTAKIFKETGAKLLWRVQYEEIKTWQG
jgi:hypothetical protein